MEVSILCDEEGVWRLVYGTVGAGACDIGFNPLRRGGGMATRCQR